MLKQFHDSRGVPIHEGDLLRSPHFRERRYRRMHYLYHVVVANKTHDVYEMIPTSHLVERLQKDGGRCWLSEDLAQAATVIHGHGPGDCMGYMDRKRIKRTAVVAEAREAGK